MYFFILSLNKLLTNSAKKKVAIMYNPKVPIEIEMTDTKVPSHFPNKIPETSNIGEPNPNIITQAIENMKNSNKFL